MKNLLLVLALSMFSVAGFSQIETLQDPDDQGGGGTPPSGRNYEVKNFTSNYGLLDYSDDILHIQVTYKRVNGILTITSKKVTPYSLVFGAMTLTKNDIRIHQGVLVIDISYTITSNIWDTNSNQSGLLKRTYTIPQ